MLGLLCDEKYVSMKNHDGRYDEEDNYGNKYGNDIDNAAFGSRSDGPIFDPIATPQSCLNLVEEDWVTMMTALWPWCHMYLRVGIYLPYK